MQPQIKIKKAMSRSGPIQDQNEEMNIPSWFHFAAHCEEFFPAGGGTTPASKPRQHPFASFMSQPEKLEAVLQAAKLENHPFAGSRSGPRPTRRAESKSIDPPSVPGFFMCKMQ
jgi:hypothetical protein